MKKSKGPNLENAGGICIVKGLDIFREYFRGFEEQYVLIGGAACNLKIYF